MMKAKLVKKDYKRNKPGVGAVPTPSIICTFVMITGLPRCCLRTQYRSW